MIILVEFWQKKLFVKYMNPIFLPFDFPSNYSKDTESTPSSEKKKTEFVHVYTITADSLLFKLLYTLWRNMIKYILKNMWTY